jgi:hypothetical protein
MTMRRILALAVLALVSGCGGGEAAPGQGAEFAPADIAAYLVVNTDVDSEEWRQADELLDRFPGRERLLDLVRDELQKEGVSWENDVKPALGDDLHLVWLDFESGGDNVVAFTKPADEQKFRQLLEKTDEPVVQRQIEGWTVFAEEESQLDRFERARAAGTLAEDETYSTAAEELPDGALAFGYLAGEALNEALDTADLQGGRLEWLVAAVVAEDDGVRLSGTVRQTVDSDLEAEAARADLLEHVPGDALAVLSFQGAQGDLEKSFQSGAIQGLEDALGIELADVLRLFDQEGIVYVRAGFPIPEVALVLESSDEADVETLETLAQKVAGLVGGRVSDTEVEGVSAKRVDVGPVQILFGRVGDRIVVSTARAAFADVEGGTLADDSRFRAAREAAGMPEETFGFLYVDLKDTLPLVESLAGLAEEDLPPEVGENLEPLTSFVVYAAGEPEQLDFTAFLEIR